MKEEFENIDKLFKSELKDFSPDVPKGSWENIAMSLANSSKSKKAPLFFWKVAAGVALFLGSATLGTYLIIHKPDLNQVANSNTETKKPITIQNDSVNVNSSDKNKDFHSNNNAVRLTNNTEYSANSNEEFISKSSNNDVITAQNNNNISFSEKQNTAINDFNKAQNSGSKIELESTTKDENKDLFTLNNNELESNNENTLQSDNQKGTEAINSSEVVKEELNDSPQDFVWKDVDNATTKTEKKEKAWSIGGQAGPQYTYRTISSEINAPERLDMSNRDESGTVAYAAGVHIEYKPARRLSVQSGIYYSKYSTQGPVNINVQANNFDPENPNATIDRVNTNELIIRFPNASVDIGEVNTTSVSQATDNTYRTPSANISKIESLNVEDVPSNTTSTRNYEYIEIPIIARYAIIDRKVNLDIIGGVSTNVLLNNNIEIDFPVDLPSDYETKNINSVNYSSTVGFGVGYDITSKISFSIEPQFKYFLSSQSNSRNDVRPYSLGMYSGIKYLF
jgi:hypothetical protein